MNREQAEKLLAALIFDDLDDASKAELQAYLQTDDELRDRLADMRMAVKLTCDAVKEGPDPVLSEHRLAQLKQLAKSTGTRRRIFTMRRFLAAAAVLMFGLVLMGLLMPSLSRRGVMYQSAVEAEKARVSALVLERRLAADSDGVTRADERRRTEPMLEDRMGGMGGYGGAGHPGVVVSRAPAVPGRRNTEITGGPSVYSYETNRDHDLNLLAGQPSSPAPTPGGKPDGSDQIEQVAGLTADARKQWPMQIVRGAKVETEDVQSESGPISLDMDVALAERPARPADEAQVRRESVRMKAAEAEAASASRYRWSGAVAPKKAAEPMLSPPAVDSLANSDKKANKALESPVAREAEAGKRVPMLGDTPVVGGAFEKSLSEIRRDLSSEGLGEQRGKAEGPSGTSSVRLNTVQDKMTLDLVAPLGQVAEGAEAGVPLTSHVKVVPINPWVMTDRDRLSTFALDVDTASYALCGRYIRGGFLPPVGAVRMEEFINAFDYAYPQRDDATFAVYAEGAPSPFTAEGQDLTLLKVAVKARTVGRDQRRAAHLVFVVDASASMGQADRLPAVQAALNLLVDKLSDVDRVSLITCANDARLHLESVPAAQKDAIRQAIDGIQSAGPTNLMAGLRLGYATARKAFVAGRINQVVLCSDGVANVGQTEAQAVLDEVAGDRKQGITLTCVGVGYGAYNDAFLETMADHGDGRYVFLDSSEQARDALVGQLAATLQTVAKDARIQVEFNPTRVRRYRLIGYENRDIEDQRFRDDTIDAGEVGSGQCSTALYEMELTAQRGEGVSPSNRGLEARDTEDTNLGTVFVRYRNAESGQIEEISRPLAGSIVRRRSVEQDPRFFLAAGAARFAEWLRQSEHAQHTALADVQRLLDSVKVALPLDRDVQDLAALAHQAENLPRASAAAPQP